MFPNLEQFFGNLDKFSCISKFHLQSFDLNKGNAVQGLISKQMINKEITTPQLV